MRTVERIGRKLGLGLALAAATAALAADLPRLPGELALPQGDGSPGAVAFRHDTHVDAQRPSCVACHPARFSILGGRAAGRRPAIRHEAMVKGQACGACHGVQAFGFDTCEMCHKS